MKRQNVFFFVGIGSLFATSANAGAPVPAPLVGTLGPSGVLVAAVGYLGYRVYKHYRGRKDS